MIRISVLSMMFALAVGAAGAQQLPPQPPPFASLMGQGNDQERAAWRCSVLWPLLFDRTRPTSRKT